LNLNKAECKVTAKTPFMDKGVNQSKVIGPYHWELLFHLQGIYFL